MQAYFITQEVAKMKITEITESLKRKEVIELKALFDQPIPLDQAIDIIRPYVIDSDLFAI